MQGTSFSFKKIEFGPYREISRYFFSFERNQIVAVIKKSNLRKQCTGWIFIMICYRNIHMMNNAMQGAPSDSDGAPCVERNEVSSYAEKRIGKEV